MAFSKYASLGNKEDKARASLQACIEAETLPSGVVYEVTPKLHGSNLSVLVERDRPTQICRRGGVLKEKEKFFGVQEWLPDYLPWDNLLHLFIEAQSVQVFGELCGGGGSGGKAAVQKEVYYSDNYSFTVFDIAVKSPAGRKRYLSPGHMRSVMCEVLRRSADVIIPAVHDLPLYVTPHFRGSFNDAVAWAKAHANDRVCDVYLAMGKCTDIGEGWVVRPAVLSSTGSGLCDPMHDPLLLKVKSTPFLETIALQGPRKPKKKPAKSAEESKEIEECRAYATDGRCAAVLSKVLEDQRNLGQMKVLGPLLYDDMKAEMAKDGVCLPDKLIRREAFAALGRYLRKRATK